MSRQDLLMLVEEGVRHGRISPHLAAYISAEVRRTEAQTTAYTDTVRRNDVVRRDDPT